MYDKKTAAKYLLKYSSLHHFFNNIRIVFFRNNHRFILIDSIAYEIYHAYREFRYRSIAVQFYWDFSDESFCNKFVLRPFVAINVLKGLIVLEIHKIYVRALGRLVK